MGEPTGKELRRLLENLQGYVSVIDRDLRFLWFNRLESSLEPGALEGKGVADLTAPEWLTAARAAIEGAFESGEATTYDAVGYGQGSFERWYRTRVVPFVGEGGQPRALLISDDVTEERRAREALEASERRFRRLVEDSPDYVMTFARDGTLRYINREPETGSTRESLIGRSLDALCHPDSLERVRAALDHTFETGTPSSYESRGRRGQRWYLNRAIRIEPEQVLVTSTDITDRRTTEERNASLQAQLERAQKMETIGNLAGGVAHDFNNLLLVVRVQLDLARASYEDGDDPRVELEGARDTIGRMQDLTTRLLAVARRQPSRPKRIDLTGHIAQTMQLVRRTMPESVQVDVALPEQPLHVVADPAQLEQVLLNLCFNARDAIETTGSVTLTLRPCAREGGPHACVSVADDGHGMDAATLAKALDPFFTTKPAGRGTGLGLPMVQGLVESHGGELELTSTPREGTTVTFWLPTVEPAQDEASGEVALPAAAPQGEEVVLLAEDDPLVRHNVGRLLRRAGYEVVEASDGQQAVEQFRRERDAIDLVLLDVVLPLLTGREVYDELRRIDPHVPIVLTSGYSTSVVDSTWIEERGVEMLAKPYSIRTLLETIRAQLDAR